jgi:hypothetical protein
MIVYRNELSKKVSIEWLVNLHENLLSGSTGRLVNGLQSALGFWCFFFILLWGISWIYFSFPKIFNALFLVRSR